MAKNYMLKLHYGNLGRNCPKLGLLDQDTQYKFNKTVEVRHV